jgi:hypothetical protein
MQNGSSLPPDRRADEGAASRGWAMFAQSFVGIWGFFWIVAVGGVAAGGSTYVSEGQSLRARVMIAALFVIGGAIGGAVLWLLACIALAPRVQRDEARTALKELQQRPEFPDIATHIRLFSNEDEANTRLEPRIELTNRESHPLSLQFRLGMTKKDGSTVWATRLPDAHWYSVITRETLPPIRVEPHDTTRIELRFWIAKDDVDAIKATDEVAGKTYTYIPPSAFALEIEERISGTRTVQPIE